MLHSCSLTQRNSRRLQRHFFARSTIEKSFWQLFSIWKEYSKAVQSPLCLFRALVLHLHGIERLEEETSNLFNLFFETTGGTDPGNFRGVCMEDITAVEHIVCADIFLYDIDIIYRSMIGEIARRSAGKHSNTVRQLRYNSHICYVFIINGLFEVFLCPSCDQFIKTVQHLERHMSTCKK